MKRVLVLLGLCLSLAWSAPSLADPVLEPGLTLTFQSGTASDSRSTRMLALYVPANRSPTPFLPAGPFKATWTGNFISRIRDTISFSAAGRGKLKITINGQSALDVSGDDLSKTKGAPIQLKKGKNALIVEYESPDHADAELRTFWQSDTFAAEPIPPTMFSHDVSESVLVQQTALRDGRALVADLRCLRCHSPADKFSASAMPELSMDAPSLAEVGGRLNEGFMAAWITDPRAQRPQATMPRLLHGPDAAAQAKDIAAYLATLGANAENKAPALNDNAVLAGTRLFTSLGCIACHIPPDSNASDPMRLPLRVIHSKWRPGALVQFLKAPEHNYAWIRMPNFRLSDTEANNLAAYLYLKSSDQKFPTGGNASHGQALFTSLGCLNCHTGPGANNAKAPQLADLMKSDWTKGCLAKDDAARAAAPDFSLTDDQRSAIQSFAKTDWKSLDQDNPIEIAQRQFTLANCSACHIRDGRGDHWSDLRDEINQIESALPPPPDTGEKYAPDQSRPDLTWTGEKLKTEWAAKFIAGKIPYKPRPFIYARMPGFASRAPFLADGFANEHGYPSITPPDPAPDAALIPIGRLLVGKNGGFSCNACHAIADIPAAAAFEAPAPNFAHVKDRIRHDYYVRWVRNPQRVERGTRMPTFFKPDGTTAVRDVLNGNASQQFNAIWNYLLQGDQIQPPNQ